MRILSIALLLSLQSICWTVDKTDLPPIVDIKELEARSNEDLQKKLKSVPSQFRRDYIRKHRSEKQDRIKDNFWEWALVGTESGVSPRLSVYVVEIHDETTFVARQTEKDPKKSTGRSASDYDRLQAERPSRRESITRLQVQSAMRAHQTAIQKPYAPQNDTHVVFKGWATARMQPGKFTTLPVSIVEIAHSGRAENHRHVLRIVDEPYEEDSEEKEEQDAS